MAKMKEYKPTEGEQKLFNAIASMVASVVKLEKGTRLSYELLFFEDNSAKLQVSKIRYSDQGGKVEECEIVYDNYFEFTENGGLKEC